MIISSFLVRYHFDPVFCKFVNHYLNTNLHSHKTEDYNPCWAKILAATLALIPDRHDTT